MADTGRWRRSSSATWRFARWAGEWLRPYRRWLTALAGYLMLDLIFTLSIPLSSQVLFDDVIPSSELWLFAAWIAVVPCLFAGSAFTSYKRLVLGGRIGQAVLRDLR